jgi:hypothetical protein
LSSNQFERARSLFEGFDFSLSIHAAIDGKNPGRVFVDNIAQPRTAFALTVEGYLLAGEHDNAATNKAIGRLLREKIFTGLLLPPRGLSLGLDAGSGEGAFYLTAAVDHGWTNVEWTRQQVEFGILHDTAGWAALLARIENG